MISLASYSFCKYGSSLRKLVLVLFVWIVTQILRPTSLRQGFWELLGVSKTILGYSYHLYRIKEIYIYISGNKWSPAHRVLKSHRSKMSITYIRYHDYHEHTHTHIYIYICPYMWHIWGGVWGADAPPFEC